MGVTSRGMKSRVLKGIGANAIGRVIGILSAFLLPPMFLQAWGVNGYGDWVLLTSIAAYLGISDLGGQLYVVNRMTQAYAKKDFRELRTILHTGLVMFMVIPGCFYVLFSLLLLTFDPAKALNLSGVGRDLAYFVLLILAFRFMVSLPQGLLLGVYRAVGLLPRGVMLGNVLSLLLLGFTTVALMFDCGMLIVSAIQTLPVLIVGVVAMYDLSRRFVDFELTSLQYASFSLGKKFVRPSMDFFLMYLAQAFSVQGIVVIVGILFSSVQVVVFATMRTIANFLQQSLPIISHSIWPELTRMDVEKDWQRMALLMKLMLRSSLLFALVFAVLLHYYGEVGYRYWLGNQVEYHQVVMDLFLVYVMQSLFWTLCSNLLMATNRHSILSKVVIANSILTILLAWVLGKPYGLEGVVLGMIASDFLLPLWIVMYLVRNAWPNFTYLFFLKETLPVIVATSVCLMGLWQAAAALMALAGWWLLSLRRVKYAF